MSKQRQPIKSVFIGHKRQKRKSHKSNDGKRNARAAFKVKTMKKTLCCTCWKNEPVVQRIEEEDSEGQKTVRYYDEFACPCGEIFGRAQLVELTKSRPLSDVERGELQSSSAPSPDSPEPTGENM